MGRFVERPRADVDAWAIDARADGERVIGASIIDERAIDARVDPWVDA